MTTLDGTGIGIPAHMDVEDIGPILEKADRFAISEEEIDEETDLLMSMRKTANALQDTLNKLKDEDELSCVEPVLTNCLNVIKDKVPEREKEWGWGCSVM